MKILYIAVHRHKGWGAEHWLALAFERAGHAVERFDYRQKRRQLMPWWLIKQQLDRVQKRFQPDIVLLQRADKMPATVPAILNAPKVFWSTEQLARRRDMDQILIAKNLFAWVYVHTYTSVEYVNTHFPHLNPNVSVMHSASGIETLNENTDRPRLAIFNRNLSERRRAWLDACGELVDVIQGQFGETYFNDLSQSRIALNIHFSDTSLDDFETGIYEALASGCAVISETLDPRTVNDLSMNEAVVQVQTPAQMRKAIEHLRDNPDELKRRVEAGRRAIKANLWDARAQQMVDKFQQLAEAQ